MRRTPVALAAICAIFTTFTISTLARADVDPDADRPVRRPARGGKAVVAVMPFTSPTTYSAMGRNAQETFITALVQTGKLRVIQATEVSRMLRRHSLHWTGVIEPRILKAAGSWLKADYMMAGKVRYTGDAYTVSCHVSNIKTLETTMAEDIDFSDVSKMRIAMRALAKKIAGTVTGTGGGGGSKSELFLNVNPRAFYDTADACIRSMGYVVSPFRYSGTVESSDETAKTITVKGYAGSLKEGVPLDVYDTSGIGEATKVVTAYFVKKVPGGFEARYRGEPEGGGISLGAKITNHKHRWTVAVGKIEDEVEDNDKLVKRFRSALLEKISEGTKFQEIEGGSTDVLAKLSSRKTRFMTFKALHARGVDMVLEGKFYGSSGSRRAHFKIYSTLSGKLWGEPKFETSL
jgi:TolB-like protein